MIEKFLTVLTGFIGLLVVAIGIGLLFAYPISWLVNFTFSPIALSAVFGAPRIDFWHAYTLSTLLTWLVKGSK